MTATRYSHPWINTNIKRVIRQQIRAYSEAKKTQKKRDLYRFKRLQQEAKYLQQEAKYLIRLHGRNSKCGLYIVANACVSTHLVKTVTPLLIGK